MDCKASSTPFSVPTKLLQQPRCRQTTAPSLPKGPAQPLTHKSHRGVRPGHPLFVYKCLPGFIYLFNQYSRALPDTQDPVPWRRQIFIRQPPCPQRTSSLVGREGYPPHKRTTAASEQYSIKGGGQMGRSVRGDFLEEVTLSLAFGTGFR